MTDDEATNRVHGHPDLGDVESGVNHVAAELCTASRVGALQSAQSVLGKDLERLYIFGRERLSGAGFDGKNTCGLDGIAEEHREHRRTVWCSGSN